jgi:hypothetical protein
VIISFCIDILLRILEIIKLNIYNNELALYSNNNASNIYPFTGTLRESAIPFNYLLNITLKSILNFLETKIKHYILNIISNKFKDLFAYFIKKYPLMSKYISIAIITYNELELIIHYIWGKV